MDSKNKEMVNNLLEAIMTLETKEECERFFCDLCSVEELNKISRRVLIAKLIIEGENYRSILGKTNTANITISRIKTILNKEGSVLSDVVKRANTDKKANDSGRIKYSV